MIPASTLYTNSLRHSHESVTRVIAYEGDALVGQLAVNNVSLTLDANSDIQRSADITVGVDPLRTEARDALELLTTGKGSVVIQHGITYSGIPLTEYVTIATLRIDEMTQSATGATRTLRCFDRTLLLQEYTLPTARPLDGTYVELIQALIEETLPSESVVVEAGIDLLSAPAPGKSFNRGDDRLRRIQELAASIDAWLVCEPDGSFALKHAPGSTYSTEQDSQWHFNQGDQGVLIDAESTFSRREQYNAVGLEFVPADDAGEWSGFIFLWDNDPASPTFFDGDFGKRPMFYTEEYDHLPSAQLAEAVARRKLYEHSGITRAIRVTGIYNPLLLPGDKVSVDVPNEDDAFSTEVHYIERLDLDLGGSAAMTVDTRLVRLPGSLGIIYNGVGSGGGNASIVLGGNATGVGSAIGVPSGTGAGTIVITGGNASSTDPYPTIADAQVMLNPGDSYQAKINAEPAGTIFGMSGTYNGFIGINARAGDWFVGDVNNKPQILGAGTSTQCFLGNGYNLRGLDISGFTGMGYQIAAFSGNDTKFIDVRSHHNQVGFNVGSRTLALRCETDYNQGTGIKSESSGGGDIRELAVVRFHKSHHNNPDGVNNADWEAGGSKFVNHKNLLIEDSEFYDNVGVGLWFDQTYGNCTVRRVKAYNNYKWQGHFEISPHSSDPRACLIEDSEFTNDRLPADLGPSATTTQAAADLYLSNAHLYTVRNCLIRSSWNTHGVVGFKDEPTRSPRGGLNTFEGNTVIRVSPGNNLNKLMWGFSGYYASRTILLNASGNTYQNYQSGGSTFDWGGNLSFAAWQTLMDDHDSTFTVVP